MDELTTRRGRGREIAMGLAALAGSTLVALALGEAWVRLTWGDMMPMRVISKQLIRQGDARVGYKLKPDVDYTFENKVFGKVRFGSNSKGLRENKEIPYEKPAGEKRLLALGDSFTYGNWVNEEDAYVARIERALPGWEALNAGVMGWSTEQEVGWLQWEGLKYRPDVVVLFFCIQNDFLLPGGEEDDRRIFSLRDGRLVENPGDKSHKWRERGFFSRAVVDRLDLIWFLRIKGEQLKTGLLGGRRAPDQGLIPFRVDYPNEAERPGFEMLQALLRAARDASEAAGAKFLLATVDMPGVHEAFWKEFVAQYDAKPEDYDRGHAEGLIRAFAEREGIAFAALSETLARHPEEEHFLPEDGHYSPLGHRRAAEAVVAKLRELGWVE